jgi:hypothetical protein
MAGNRLAVAGRNSCGFLAAMLQTVQGKKGLFRRIGIPENTEQTAVFLLVHKHRLYKDLKKLCIERVLPFWKYATVYLNRHFKSNAL